MQLRLGTIFQIPLLKSSPQYSLPYTKEKRHLQLIYFMNYKHLCFMYERILFRMKQFVNIFLKLFENLFPCNNN